MAEAGNLSKKYIGYTCEDAQDREEYFHMFED
jgi:hypothetical protein